MRRSCKHCQRRPAVQVARGTVAKSASLESYEQLDTCLQEVKKNVVELKEDFRNIQHTLNSMSTDNTPFIPVTVPVSPPAAVKPSPEDNDDKVNSNSDNTNYSKSYNESTNNTNKINNKYEKEADSLFSHQEKKSKSKSNQD